MTTTAPAKAPHKNWTLVAVCLGTLMLLIDITVVFVALPNIRSSLHTSFTDVQWTIDAYSLSLAALLLPTGSLADIFGRRRVFAVGPGIFTLGSLLCGLSTSSSELVIWRAVQGIGGATVFATSLALLAQTFQGGERGFAFSVWGGVIAASSALGPLLGGILTTELSWHWIFFVNIQIGSFAIAVTLTRVQEFRPPGHRRIDLIGFLLFTLGLTALVYGLIESGFKGWGSSEVIGALVVSAVSSPRESPCSRSSCASVSRTCARISNAICSNSRVQSELALPASLVPSIAINPGLTSPARSHSLSTSLNSSASACSCRQMNLEIVA